MFIITTALCLRLSILLSAVNISSVKQARKTRKLLSWLVQVKYTLNFWRARCEDITSSNSYYRPLNISSKDKSCNICVLYMPFTSYQITSPSARSNLQPPFQRYNKIVYWKWYVPSKKKLKTNAQFKRLIRNTILNSCNCMRTSKTNCTKQSFILATLFIPD